MKTSGFPVCIARRMPLLTTVRFHLPPWPVNRELRWTGNVRKAVKVSGFTQPRINSK